MIKEAIEFLITRYQPLVKGPDSSVYLHSEYKKELDPVAEPFRISSLSGIVDYIRKKREKLSSIDFIHVESYCKVNVVGFLNADMNRDMYAVAKCPHNRYKTIYNEWHDLESFIIKIKSDFVQDENTEKLLKLSSKIDLSDTASLKDDGVSQEVSVKSGVHLVNKEELPSLIKLRPYATFTELEQPACDFVYRVRKNRDRVQIGLFECENANWQIKAVNDISDYLREKVEITVVR